MTCISFASRDYYAQQDAWENACNTAGFEDVIKYREVDIPEDYRKYNYGKRGYGFWFWKPYLIRKTLESNEQVLYIDTDYTVIDKPTIESIAESNSMTLFEYAFKNRIWTKRDTFFYMGCDSEKYWNALHLEAGISFWNKTKDTYLLPDTFLLLDEWIECVKDRRIISDDPNVCGLPNLPEFRDHRHDQSILSNLKEKHNIKTLPITSLRGVISGADM